MKLSKTTKLIKKVYNKYDKLRDRIRLRKDTITELDLNCLETMKESLSILCEELRDEKGE